MANRTPPSIRVLYWCSRNQASRVGPATRQAIAALFDAKPIVAQAYLPARNILGMAKGTGDNKMILEEACHRLIGSGPTPRAITYTAVKNMMTAVRHDRDTRPTSQSDTPPPRPGASTPPRYDQRRDRGLLGGAEQFSLDALLGKKDNDQP